MLGRHLPAPHSWIKSRLLSIHLGTGSLEPVGPTTHQPTRVGCPPGSSEQNRAPSYKDLGCLLLRPSDTPRAAIDIVQRQLIMYLPTAILLLLAAGTQAHCTKYSITVKISSSKKLKQTSNRPFFSARCQRKAGGDGLPVLCGNQPTFRAMDLLAVSRAAAQGA